MQYIGSSSSAGKRTVAWTRNSYIGAVNVYWARESANPGYCTAADPANQPNWDANILVTNSVLSSSSIAGATIAGLTDASDYCLLIRSASASEPWALTDQFEIDNTVPTITAKETQDLDSDGKIDAVKITFSDEVLDSTVTAANFDVAGYNNEAFSSTTNGDTANNTVIYITFDEGGAVDSDATPTLAYTAGTLTDLADNALATAGAAATTDKAKPVITAVREFDMNADGKVDETMLTYSEAIVDAGVAAANYTIGGTAADAVMAATSTNTVDTNTANDAIITIKVTAGVAGTGQKAVVYTPGTTADAASNLAASQTFAAGSVTDSAKPVFTSSTTADTNANGTVDQATIVFSETVAIVDGNAGDGIPGIAFGDSCVAANADYATGATTSIVVTLGSCTAGDTSITANPTYTAAAGDIADASTNEIADAATVTGTDGAAPAVASSTGSDSDNDGKTNTYMITFTENLADRGAAGANANFTAKNTTTSAAITIDTVGIGVTAGGGANRVTLTLDDADTDNYTGLISFSYNTASGGQTIVDQAAGINATASLTDTALTDNVAPVLLSSRGGSNGGTADVLDNANEILDFVFSEPMNSSVPSIANFEAGLTFANGAADGNDNLGATNTITRITTTISNDTYRVTHTSVDSAALITPGTDTVQVTTGTNIQDTTGNTANTTPAAVTIAVADISAPTMTARETQDMDGDGKIDALKITFDDSIKDSTVVAGDFAITGYSGIAFSGTLNGDVADNTVIYLTFTEGGSVDSGATPAVTYTAGTLTDDSNNAMATNGPTAATDKAAPIYISAQATSDTNIAVTFSENLASADFTKFSVNAGTPAVSAAAVDGGTPTKVNVTVASLGNTAFTSTDLDVSAAAATDGNANTSTAAMNQSVTDGQAPTFVSARATSNTGVEVTFSEVLSATDFTKFAIDAGGVTVSAAAVNGGSPTKVNLTVSALGSTAFTSTDLDVSAAAATDSGSITSTAAMNQSIADGQAPTVTAVNVSDNDGDGILDRATIAYSEAIANVAAAANGFDVTSAANHGTCASESADPDSTTTVVLSFACTTVNTTVGDITIGFTANANMADAATNQTASTSLSSASSPAITDAAKPVALSAAITKAISNGNLQNSAVIEVTFSEAVTPTSVVDGNWKFTRNGVETALAANWPDGATVTYGTGSSATNVKMTLSAPTTSGIWTSGAKLNLSGTSIATIQDAATNSSTSNAANISISGLIGPSVDAIAVTAKTNTTATIGWVSGGNTTSNRVSYGTTPTLGSGSTVGSPGENGTTHSIDLTGLTAGTLYYYQVCSTSTSETCSAIQNFTTNVSVEITNLSVNTVTHNSAVLNYATDVTPDTKEYRVGTGAYIGTWTSLGASPYSITGLSADTTYYVQARFVKNGQTVQSSPMSFRTAAAATGVTVTSITRVLHGDPTVGGNFTNGYHFRFAVTANSLTETGATFKLADWSNGASTLAILNNTKMVASATGMVDYATASGSTTNVTTAYGTAMNVSAFDSDPTLGGRQFVIDVFYQIPSGAGGSYTTSYGLQTQ